MDFFYDFLPTFLLIVDYLVRIGLAIRIVMRRLSVGVSLAWLTVVLAFPIAGMVVYLLIGELRLGNMRARWAKEIHEPFQRWLKRIKGRLSVDWSKYSYSSQALSIVAEKGIDIPALPGNDLELMTRFEDVFDRLIEDIDQSQRTCHLMFYIWHPKGRSEEIVEALIRARHRGVICRVLVDSVGSRPFLKSKQLERLREHGIQVRNALPAGIFRMLFVRFDLRLHRKIVVIDGEVAYTGSMNLVDPRFFKQTVGVGQWIDAMARLTGPAVEALAVTFLEDWALETNESIDSLSQTGDVHPIERRGEALVHVVPSGPAIRRTAIDRVLLTAIYESQKSLTLTSPYFVPDESLLYALTTAARRGVKVRLIVPELVDSRLVRYASQAHQDDLLESGVEIHKFHGGLLHTKSVIVDDEIVMFGSLNLDPRSLHLNFEITLLIHDEKFASQLSNLQEDYLAQCRPMKLEDLDGRRFSTRLAINLARLLGPLL